MARTRQEVEKWFRETLKFEKINSRNGTVNCGYCALELHKRIVEGGVVTDKPVPTRDARIRLEVDYVEDIVTRVASEDPRITQPFSESGDEAFVLSIDISTGEEYYTEKNEDGTKERVRFTVYDCEEEGVDGLYKMLKAQPRDAEGVCFGLLSLSRKESEKLVIENDLIVGHLINYYVSGDDIFFLDAQEKTIAAEINLKYFKPQISYVQAKHRPSLAPSQESIVTKSESSSASLTAIPTAPAPQAVAKKVSFYASILEAARKQDKPALQRALNEVSINIRRLGNPYCTPAGELAAEGSLEAVSFLKDHGAGMQSIARGAAMGGHRGYADELRAEGAHINAIAQGAAMGGHRGYAEELRAEGANINAIAHSAAMSGHREYAEELRAAGANIDIIAQAAAMGGHLDYADKLRSEEGANIDFIVLGSAQGGYDDYTKKLHVEGANIDSIAIGIAASGRLLSAEKLRIKKSVNIDVIVQGALTGGHLEYAEKLRAAGANIDVMAYGAAMSGHLEYAKKLRAEGANIDLIAQGAARGGYVEYAEKLRKERKDNIEAICTSSFIGVFEMKKQLLIEYKNFVDALAQHAAQGGQEAYAEYLRINEGADIKWIAQGAAVGGHEKYVEKLYFLNEGVTIDCILDYALFSGHMMYAERLWREHEKFANSTPCDVGPKKILCEEHKRLTEHFVKRVLKYGKIEYAERLRTQYNVDVNLIVKYAALYHHEEYSIELCMTYGADVGSIKAASNVPGISSLDRSRICAMHMKVKTSLSASVSPNVSIDSNLQPHSDSATSSSATSASSSKPAAHHGLPDAPKRKSMERRNAPETKRQRRENEPNAPTRTRTSENRSTFLSSSSSTTTNYPIVPLPALPPLPVSSTKKTC